MKILVLGGCFPFQDFIPPDRLYHRTLCQRLAATCPVTVVPIRYERITNTLAKIETECNAGQVAAIVFHLRGEPFMRITKFWYRYQDAEGRKKWAFHIARLTDLFPEMFEIPVPDRQIIQTYSYPKETLWYHAFREANYHIGVWMGNQTLAFRLYSGFVSGLHAFCQARGIHLLVTGPVSRPFSRFEDHLSHKISLFFQTKAQQERFDYMPLLGLHTITGESMFFPNGIHVSQAGHDEVGEKLYQWAIASIKEG